MFKPEQLAKAKATKSVEELLAYAKEVGYALTEEEAKVFFEQWNKEGELADEELENVSGGSFVSGCSTYSSDPPNYLITTMGNSCNLWEPDDSLAAQGTLHTCAICMHKEGDVPLYCTRRKYGDDPLNP